MKLAELPPSALYTVLLLQDSVFVLYEQVNSCTDKDNVTMSGSNN